MRYEVVRAAGPVALDGNWNGGEWKKAGIINISNYMGTKPEHQPKTQAKVLYDNAAIYVMFRVEDSYVRAVASHQGPVCQDSCVEFFFIPAMVTDKGYFNLEVNCGGNMLFHWQTRPGVNNKEITAEDCRKIDMYHSMPSRVEPEVTGATIWTIAYRLPLEILGKYMETPLPKSGTVWRANFYKCADKTSHPHWLTWNVVNKPQPNFHVPEDFGEIVFK